MEDRTFLRKTKPSTELHIPENLNPVADGFVGRTG
jgi:hypothetical protein